MPSPQYPSRLRLPRPGREPRAPARRRTRRAAQVRAHPLGRRARRHRRLRRQGLLARHQARRRQGGVEAQRRLLQLAERRHPGLAAGDDARRRSTCSAAVMLNMDAPHHTRLRKIISRGFTPRAIGRLRGGARPARAEHRQDAPRRRAPATSSSRCRASCRCRPSPACSACRRRTATSSSAGPTR